MEKTDTFNSDYSQYYNLLYQDKDYKSEAKYITALIKKFSGGAKDILELGCGTGNHGVLFQQEGYNLVGVERSSEMAVIAKQRGVSCVVADIADFSIDKKFDVCLSLFHVISYITENDGLLRAFRNTRAHLNKGAVFIFDVWFTPAVMSRLPEVRVKRLEDNDVSIIRIAEPGIDFVRNTVEVNYHMFLRDKKASGVREFRESHLMRHFTVPEIALLSGQTGFSLTHAEEFLSGKAPDNTTWGVNFILTAI
jgi:SAM-dependent methyltransferase